MLRAPYARALCVVKITILIMDDFDNVCLTLQSVCSSIQTMLGPSKSLKCYISSEGDSGILGDTFQVLDALMSSYQSCTTHQNNILSIPHHQHSLTQHSPPPVLQLLHECCHEQQRRMGCGVTTLICMASYWAPEILNLIHEGVPLPVIFTFFREALDMCRHLCKTLLIKQPDQDNLAMARLGKKHETSSNTLGSGHKPVGSGHSPVGYLRTGKNAWTKKQAKVLTFSRHFRVTGNASGCVEILEPDPDEFWQSVSEKLAHGKETAMKLALEAKLEKDKETRSHQTSSTRLPLQYFLVGKPKEQSRIVRGVVSDLHPEMLSLSRDMAGGKMLNILLLDGDCSPGFRHLGFQRNTDSHWTSHELSLLYEESRDLKWLHTSIATIQKFEVNVLAVGGTVWPLLWQYCIGANILVLKEISADIQRAITYMCEVKPLTYLTQCSKDNIGKDVSIEVLESGWDRPRVTYGSNTELKKFSAKKYCCRLFKGSAVPQRALITALLCGLTESSVDNLRHQFINCFHRLDLAIERKNDTLTEYQLLPGSGKTEAMCINMLEKDSDKRTFQDKKLPLYFTHSWMNEPALLLETRWRAAVHQAYANGLRKYVTRIIMNSSPGWGQFEAMCKVEDMIERGISTFSLSGVDIIDVAVCKMEGWQRAIQLLETTFSSKTIRKKA